MDSYGGNIATLESLIGLLKCADQDGNKCAYYAAVTNSAYSAAALLVSFSDYSIAYNHSSILFHDIRFSEVTDVTPKLALQTAKDLQSENDRLALRLAAVVVKRLIWVYLDLMPELTETRKRYPDIVKQFELPIDEICPKNPDNEIDVLGFTLTIFDRVKQETASDLILKTLTRLTEWIFVENIERTIIAHEKGNNASKPLEGINQIYQTVNAARKVPVEASSEEKQSELMLNLRLQNDLRLFLEIILRRASKDPNWTISQSGFEEVQRDFDLIKGLKSQAQVKLVVNMMMEHATTFFGGDKAEELQKTTDIAARNAIIAPFFPQARLFWYFAVLLCRSLFDGEHILSAHDAQLLGLVDEVIGGGSIESRREYRKRRVREEMKETLTSNRPEQ